MRWLLAGAVVVALGCAGVPQVAEAEGDQPGECADGADNDRDGAFDCKDDECAGAPVCQPAPAAPVAAAAAPATAPTAAAPGAVEPAKLAGKHKAKVAPGGTGGDCAGACRHLMKCAGESGLQAECVVECVGAGHDAEFLGWFVATDCGTALTVVAMLAGDGGGGQAAGGKKSGECQGCVWDGSGCNWYSQGDWGSQNAYSGAVISCNSGCCGR